MAGRTVVRITGPLAPYAPGFGRELRSRGYTHLSAAGQLRLMAHVSRWLASEGLAARRSRRSGRRSSVRSAGGRAIGRC